MSNLPNVTCLLFDVDMYQGNISDHLNGRKHIARVKNPKLASDAWFDKNGQYLISKGASRIQKLRQKAFVSQKGRCCYCYRPVWEAGQEENHAKWFHLDNNRMLQCTAEHKKPKSKGGGLNSSNIAASCLECNRARGHSEGSPSKDVTYF